MYISAGVLFGVLFGAWVCFCLIPASLDEMDNFRRRRELNRNKPPSKLKALALYIGIILILSALAGLTHS
jgi:hypothetical protein